MFSWWLQSNNRPHMFYLISTENFKRSPDQFNCWSQIAFTSPHLWPMNSKIIYMPSIFYKPLQKTLISMFSWLVQKKFECLTCLTDKYRKTFRCFTCLTDNCRKPLSASSVWIQNMFMCLPCLINKSRTKIACSVRLSAWEQKFFYMPTMFNWWVQKTIKPLHIWLISA